jgi:hypothetical protein
MPFSNVTWADGSFWLIYDDNDFKIINPQEKRPDLHLSVLAPEEPGCSGVCQQITICWHGNHIEFGKALMGLVQCLYFFPVMKKKSEATLIS